MREIIPDVSVTTDIIAGFPGETEADHQVTAEALRTIRYDGAYIYKYSERPGTPAARLKDDVPENEKILESIQKMSFQTLHEPKNHRFLVCEC